MRQFLRLLSVGSRKNLSRIVAGLGGAAALLLAPIDAAACSCVPLDPWEAYGRSDAAIVGVYEGKQGPTTYRFRVEEDYKAELPGRLDVQSAEHGASCGLEVRVGARIGLFLSRRGDGWSSSLCSQARPEQVRIAARGLPRPNGSGPVRFIVGGGFGPARVIALDAAGRTLAYGRGGGKVVSVAVCPGARRSIELAEGRLAWRDLRTFRVLREVPLGRRAGEFSGEVHCTGRDAFAALSGETRVRLLRIRGRSVRTITVAGRAAIAFAGRRAYLSTPTRVFSLDLVSGRTRTLAGFSAEQLTVSRDGTLLAALSGGTLFVIRVGDRRVVREPLGAEGSPRLVWAGHRIAVLDWDASVLYDSELRLVGRLPGWGVSDAVGTAGRIVGVGFGAMRVARLPRGPLRLLRDLLSPNTFAIAAVDRGPNIRLAVTLPCARG